MKQIQGEIICTSIAKFILDFNLFGDPGKNLGIEYKRGSAEVF
jgi:hypothetical protein